MRQMNFIHKLVLVSAIMLSATCFVHAQSATQGGISGTVFDSANAAIPNATVLIHNDGTGSELKLTTDENGLFRAPLLPPGTYTVSISAPGFSELKSNGVLVQVNQLTEFSPHLSTGATSTTVEVTAAAPVIQFDSPAYGGYLSNKEIENIPINNRRWSALALMTPGVTSDNNGFGLLSFRAISSLLNNVQIDGADDNQAFFSEERGRTRAGYSTSQVAVREFQVNTGVYSAELGRAVGGVVNSVTKSGSNSLHGEAYFYRRDDQFSAFNPYTTFTSYNPSTATASTIPYRPKDKRNQYGFGVGGPLIKDKLFWFYAFDVFDRQFPGTARANSPASFFAAPSSATISTLANRLGITTTAAATAYNNHLAAMATDLGSVPRYGHQNINTPKIDWQINPKHTVSFLYHRLRWDSPGGVQTQATNTYARDSFGTDFVKLDYGVAKLDSLITSHFTNEIRYQYGRELNDEGQQPYTDYSKNYLQNPSTGNIAQYSLLPTTIGFYFGSPYYSYRTAYPDERKWQIGDTASIQIGKHAIRFGEDIVHNFDLQNNLYESNGFVSYGSVLNYMSDVLSAGTSKTKTCDAAGTGVGTLPCYSSYAQGVGPSTFQLSTVDYAFFVQDDWKLTPRLTLNLGVRYDYESLPAPFDGLTTISQTTNHPSDKNNISPRLGFAYDPYGRGKTVIRGGYGMFFGRIPNAVLLNAYENTGSAKSQAVVSFTASSTGAPQFRDQVSATGSAASIYYLDKNLQNPMTHQFDLAVQQDLGRSTVLSLSYVGALGRELPNYINTNIDPSKNYTVTYNVIAGTNGSCGPLACGSIQNKVYAGRVYAADGKTLVSNAPNASYNGITDVLSNVNSSYNGMTVEVTNRSNKWATFDAYYTWAHALDFSQNAFTAASTNNWLDPFGNQRLNYGNSSLNVPHRFVAWTIVNLPGTTSNNWYSYAANGWSLKPLFQMQSGLPYSASVASNSTTPSQCYNAGCLAPSAAMSSGLAGTTVTYIPQIGRNTFQQPRTINLDMRAQKDFKLNEKYNLQFIAESFNLANHQNVTAMNTTAYTIATDTSTKGTKANPYVTLTPSSTFGKPSATNGNYNFRERQFQFALRLMF